MDCLRVKDQWFRKEDKKNMKENLSLVNRMGMEH